MILDAQLYLERRKKNLLTRYRLKRRTEKVLEVIKTFFDSKPISVLDIGAADGSMLSVIKNNFNVKEAVGIEPNEELIVANKDNGIKIIKGVGENLPFENNIFDVVIISATIEHTQQPKMVLSETYRVLKNGGVVILITVVPILDKIAEKLRIFPKSLHKHFNRFNLKDLRVVLKQNGFEILKLTKFALPTFELLGLEKILEEILAKFNFNIFMTYELAVGRKTASS